MIKKNYLRLVGSSPASISLVERLLCWSLPGVCTCSWLSCCTPASGTASSLPECRIFLRNIFRNPRNGWKRLFFDGSETNKETPNQSHFLYSCGTGHVISPSIAPGCAYVLRGCLHRVKSVWSAVATVWQALEIEIRVVRFALCSGVGRRADKRRCLATIIDVRIENGCIDACCGVATPLPHSYLRLFATINNIMRVQVYF